MGQIQYGWWIPVFKDIAHTQLNYWAYHCIRCTTTMRWDGKETKCKTCGNQIDFSTLKERDR